MKRADLIKQINKIAQTKGITVSYTEGGKHTKVQIGDQRSTIPRHGEINEFTAKGILAKLSSAKEEQ